MTQLGVSVDPTSTPAPASSAADQLTQYKYDELNRARRAHRPAERQHGSYELRRGRQPQVSETDENDGHKTYDYDDLNRLDHDASTRSATPPPSTTTSVGNLLTTTRALSLDDASQVAITRHAYDKRQPRGRRG